MKVKFRNPETTITGIYPVVRVTSAIFDFFVIFGGSRCTGSKCLATLTHVTNGTWLIL